MSAQTYSYIMSVSGSTYQVTNVSTGAIVYSGSSSALAFNKMMSLATSGAFVEVETGAYTVTATWNITVSDITVNFASGAVLTTVNAFNNYPLYVSNSNVTISGITINGNGLNQSPSATTKLSGSNLNYGILVNGNNCLIVYSTIYNCRSYGITTQWDVAIQLLGVVYCTLYNIGANALSTGTDWGGQNGVNCYFENNTVYGCGDVGIDSYGTNTIITGNTIYNCTSTNSPMYGYVNSYWGIGIEYNGGTGNGDYLFIAGNTITNVTGGINLNSSGNGAINYVLISGNQISNINGGSAGINMSESSYCIVEFNNINTAQGGIWLGSGSTNNVYGNTYTKCSYTFSNNGTNTITTAPTIVALQVTSSPIGIGFIAVNAKTVASPNFIFATVGTSVSIAALSPTGYTWENWNDGGAQTHTITTPSVNTVYTATFTTTPITPTQTYLLNWAITPTSGNIPFTISFAGYLSRSSSTLDTGTILNGETILLQMLAPGSTTWTDTGATAITGADSKGNTGYFSGTWTLTVPTIVPGQWQFRSYYAGNTIKDLVGCEAPFNTFSDPKKTNKKRFLSGVNALLL